MIRPQPFTARIIKKEAASSKTSRLTISLTNPEEMVFIPGQFVNLRCDAAKYRSYSIAGDYKNPRELLLLIDTAHDGVGSNYVRKITENSEVQLIGPSGKFLLHEPLPQQLYFYSTGTGLAPFLAMFYKLEDINYHGKIMLFAGFRRESEALELPLLENFKDRLRNFNYEICYSAPDNDGHEKKYITRDLKKHIDLSAQYYICGRPDMIDDVVTTLNNEGVHQENIIVEGFTRKIQK